MCSEEPDPLWEFGVPRAAATDVSVDQGAVAPTYGRGPFFIRLATPGYYEVPTAR